VAVVTVCELIDDSTKLDQQLIELYAYAKETRSDFLLLPEMLFQYEYAHEIR
jgi:hypothetical protein